MSKQRVNGALDSAVSMMMYYHQALVEDGNLDPKREMATVLSKMINLSEAQSRYVLTTLDDNPVAQMMDSMQIILKSMIVDSEKGVSVKTSELTILQNSLKELNKILGGDVNGNV